MGVNHGPMVGGAIDRAMDGDLRRSLRGRRAIELDSNQVTVGFELPQRRAPALDDKGPSVGEQHAQIAAARALQAHPKQSAANPAQLVANRLLLHDEWRRS